MFGAPYGAIPLNSALLLGSEVISSDSFAGGCVPSPSTTQNSMAAVALRHNIRRMSIAIALDMSRLNYEVTLE